ncbi:hypothetical protein GGX14DRAFT_571448 [Mycena pura]|uniref:Uncharacterized protein n=1 Tax=Mycena pura TaxID=153505 RepID=A0AAD6V3F9_9AGAR|nr:hypothetical protein GGX14DRAFT_571448 [Mycena pura]
MKGRKRGDSARIQSFILPFTLCVAGSFDSPSSSESSEALHSLLASLKPPVSQSAADDALNYLAQAPTNVLVTAEDAQEKVLKESIKLQLVCTREAEIDAEEEWWANDIEHSCFSVAWFLLQTLPSRLTRVLRTILDATRDRRLSFRPSLFSPYTCLFSLDAPFPAHASITTIYMVCSIWSAVFLPLHLTQEECRYNQRKLRDERAEQLGRLAQLRLATLSADAFPGQLVAHISNEPPVAQNNLGHVQHISSVLLPNHVAEHGAQIQQLRRPSWPVLLWPKLLLDRHPSRKLCIAILAWQPQQEIRWTHQKTVQRIERLLVSQPRVAHPAISNSLSAQTTGLLLISVKRLRAYAESSLPAGSLLREGFLEDVVDLEDLGMPREEKLLVVERMWRSWGGVLGWNSITGEAASGI